MTPQSIIQTARQVVNDTDPDGLRQTDAELLKYVNDGLGECCNLSPQTFLATGDYTCTPGQTEQRITFADARALGQVLRIKDGKAVHPTDFMALSRYNPNWAAEDAAPAQNWARMANDPLRFYIYPKAPSSMQTLELTYVKNPATYALNDTIGDVPETWEGALADYVIYRAESKDDEHTVSGRAVAHYNAFVQKITGGTGG